MGWGIAPVNRLSHNSAMRSLLFDDGVTRQIEELIDEIMWLHLLMQTLAPPAIAWFVSYNWRN